MDCKEIQPVYPKGDQSWVFTGGTDVKAETPILWPPDAESWLIWKDPDAGKDWRQEKGTSEDEMDGITDTIDMSLNKLQEMETATHSSILAWRIPWTEELSRLIIRFKILEGFIF